MTAQHISRLNFIVTTLVTAVTTGLLAWQYTHDGVPVHYLFHNKDLPGFSNWWGLMILPLLSLFSFKLLSRRLATKSDIDQAVTIKYSIIGFLASAVWGFGLSLAFLNGYNDAAALFFFTIPVFGLFFKVYREPFFFGFVFSMSFAFGPILPLMFATIIAIAGFCIHHTSRAIGRTFQLQRSARSK